MAKSLCDNHGQTQLRCIRSGNWRLPPAKPVRRQSQSVRACAGQGPTVPRRRTRKALPVGRNRVPARLGPGGKGPGDGHQGRDVAGCLERPRHVAASSVHTCLRSDDAAHRVRRLTTPGLVCTVHDYRVVQNTDTLCFVRHNFIKYWPILELIHYENQQNICNNTFTKDPTTPQVCRYTTL